MLQNSNLSKRANVIVERIQKILEAENVHVSGSFKFKFKNDESIEMQELSGHNYVWSGITKAYEKEN